MRVIDYLLLWSVAIAFAAVCDTVWMRKIRPWLTAHRGWPEPMPDEVIPTWAWVGAVAVTGLFFIAVPFVGYAAGF